MSAIEIFNVNRLASATLPALQGTTAIEILFLRPFLCDDHPPCPMICNITRMLPPQFIRAEIFLGEYCFKVTDSLRPTQFLYDY